MRLGVLAGTAKLARALTVDARPTVDPATRTARLDAERRLLEALQAFEGTPVAFHVHPSDTITPDEVGGLPVRRNHLCPKGQVFLFDGEDDATAVREAQADWIARKGQTDG